MKGLRFRIAGMPVHVEPAFLFLALIIGFLGRQGIGIFFLIASVFVSVLVHELGHAFAFRAFGRQPEVVLHGMGGRTGAPGPPLSRGADILVTVAGSASQILLLGVPAAKLRYSLALRFHSPEVYDALTDLAWVSLVWGFLNLAPVLPLDGGRIATRVLELFTRNAQRIAHAVSAVVAAGGAAYGFARREPFLGMMGLMLAGLNVRGMGELRDAPVLEQIHQGHRLIDAGDTTAALNAADQAAKSRSAPVRNAAHEMAAWAHLARGNEQAAEASLARRAKGAERSGYLAGYLALGKGDRDAALVVLTRAYASERPFPPNRLLALLLAREGMIEALADQLIALKSIPSAAGVASLANDLHDAGAYAEAVALRRRLYDLGLDPAGDAYNVACAYARLGETATALAWLERALDHGFDDTRVIDADPDLDALRDREEFTAQRRRLGVGP